MTLDLDRRALLGGLSLLAIPRFAQAAATAEYPALQAFIDGYVGAGKLPGAVVAIRRGKTPVRYLSAGTLAFDTDRKAGPDSLYRIYSMTKPVTALATLKLIEDGKLKLDQPLSDILPDFAKMQVIVDPKTMETRPATRPILIRHLLTHTAGFSYSISDNPLARLYIKNGIKPGSRAKGAGPGEELPPLRDLEDLGQRLAKMPLMSEPGERWQYSVSFDLLGLVIQRVAGMPFHDYLRTKFFEPLKMADTDFMVPAAKLDRLTSVIAARDGKLVVTDDRASSPYARDRDLPSGGGGLISTARDYAQFTSMLLNEGTLDGRRVVAARTVRLLGSNLLDPGVMFGGKNGFGGGVSVILPGGERPGAEPSGSYGWFGVAGTQMWIDPTNQVSVILMIQMNPTTYPVQAELRQAAYRDLAALKA